MDIRYWAEGKHKQVDDRPFGGGPGMVLMAPPVVGGNRGRAGSRDGRTPGDALAPGTTARAGNVAELAQSHD